jgi:hypothetical protein
VEGTPRLPAIRLMMPVHHYREERSRCWFVLLQGKDSESASSPTSREGIGAHKCAREFL